MVQLFNQFSDEIAQVAETARKSLVRIVGQRGSIGAGTIWHPDGLVVTNAHVIHRNTVEVVLPDGDTYPAQVIAEDRQQDIAALAIDARDLPTIPVGNSRVLRPGNWVVALGHPFGWRDSLTAGTVIGTGANLPELRNDREWIALSLRLRPGHSGGALVNVDGELVGINTMITGPEVGFAIPVHVVTAFLKDTIGLHVGQEATRVI